MKKIACGGYLGYLETTYIEIETEDDIEKAINFLNKRPSVHFGSYRVGQYNSKALKHKLLSIFLMNKFMIIALSKFKSGVTSYGYYDNIYSFEEFVHECENYVDRG